jgi:hypothetical protein
MKALLNVARRQVADALRQECTAMRAGTLFACFTSTKVQILTPEELQCGMPYAQSAMPLQITEN